MMWLLRELLIDKYTNINYLMYKQGLGQLSPWTEDLIQTSYKFTCLSVFTVSKTPCEKLISKGSLSLGSSASLPVQTGSRENMPMLNTKILYPGKKVWHQIVI